MTPEPEPTKAYYVTVPLCGFTDLLVYADSAADALDRVANGEGESLDPQIWRVGRGKAKREPKEDR